MTFLQYRNTLLKSFRLSCEYLQTFKQDGLIKRQCTTATQARKRTSRALDSKYTEEESQRILHHLNESTPEELQVSKLLNLQKATAIYKYREMNGSFATIGDVLSVTGVGTSGLEKYCDVIKSANNLAQLKMQHEEHLRAFTPILPTHEVEKIKNIIALDLQFDRITWAKLGRDSQLKDWSHSFIFNKSYQRFDHAVYMDKLLELVQAIPNGDIFVMESKIFRITTLKVVPLAISYRVLEAMLMTILNLSLNKRVITCKPNTIGKNFNLTVGGERVSGVNIVKDLLQNKSDNIGCQVPHNLNPIFYQVDHIQQEYYTNCLLLAATFHKLVLNKT